MKFQIPVSAIVAVAFVPTFGVTQEANQIDDAFGRFWAANSPLEAQERIDDVIDSGVTFDDAFQRLRNGRDYSLNDTGMVRHSYHSEGRVEYYYDLNIPESYDPSRQYQVRFELHGGVGGRTSNEPRGNGQVRLPGAEQIYIIPYSWNDAPWWGNAQVENLRTILDQVKRQYNVNENRVVISGVSDGGTGAYFIGMRETTRFASLLPLNAFIMVLSNASIDDGRSFPENLRNKPLFVINGGHDRLYPTETVGPFVEYFASHGVETAYYPQAEGEHNTRWWPQMRETFEQFVAVHVREPHPEWITWEASESRHNRAHWLVIEELDDGQNSAMEMSDMNIVGNDGKINQFVRPGRLMFRRSEASGRVDVEREGNTILATTDGIGSFRLLLSPDVFNFENSIEVLVNGSVLFDRQVERDIETLLKWAALDNDRTMLYGAELEIRLN